jgi:hypothetical protein
MMTCDLPTSYSMLSHPNSAVSTNMYSTLTTGLCGGAMRGVFLISRIHYCVSLLSVCLWLE